MRENVNFLIHSAVKSPRLEPSSLKKVLANDPDIYILKIWLMF